MPLTTARSPSAAAATTSRQASAPYVEWSRLPTTATAGRSKQLQPAHREEGGGWLGDGRKDRRVRLVAGSRHWPPWDSTSRSTRAPSATELALIAVAQARDIPGTAHKNSNGAARAP